MEGISILSETLQKDAILAALCIEAKTVFELVIPLVMASIVDVGVANIEQALHSEGFRWLSLPSYPLCWARAAMFSARCGQGWGRRS